MEAILRYVGSVLRMPLAVEGHNRNSAPASAQCGGVIQRQNASGRTRNPLEPHPYRNRDGSLRCDCVRKCLGKSRGAEWGIKASCERKLLYNQHLWLPGGQPNVLNSLRDLLVRIVVSGCAGGCVLLHRICRIKAISP